MLLPNAGGELHWEFVCAEVLWRSGSGAVLWKGVAACW